MNEEPNMTTSTTKTKKTKAPKAPKAPKGKPRASDSKRKPAPRRTKADGKETATAIVRRHFEANKSLGFAKVVELAVADGVNKNTARGALVRVMKAAGSK